MQSDFCVSNVIEQSMVDKQMEILIPFESFLEIVEISDNREINILGKENKKKIVYFKYNDYSYMILCQDDLYSVKITDGKGVINFQQLYKSTDVIPDRLLKPLADEVATWISDEVYTQIFDQIMGKFKIKNEL